MSGFERLLVNMKVETIGILQYGSQRLSVFVDG